jgi:hypothetical protein
MKLLKRITELADKSADRFAAAVDAIIAPAELPQRAPEASTPPAVAALLELPRDPNQEKRAALRSAVQLPGTAAIGLAAIPDPVQVRDMSVSGLCFVAPFRLGVGEVVELSVTLPQEENNPLPRPVRYQARVVHAQPEGNEFLHGASIRRCIAVPIAA